MAHGVAEVGDRRVWTRLEDRRDADGYMRTYSG
jgi:hypothetical protein